MGKRALCGIGVVGALALVACGGSGDESGGEGDGTPTVTQVTQAQFADRYVAAWCPLVVDCKDVPPQPTPFRVDTIENCKTEVGNFIRASKSDNCEYSPAKSEDLLERLERVRCEEFVPITDDLLYARAFPCKHTT